MSYVDSNLMQGERVMHRAQLHWSIYIPGVVLSVFGIGVIMLIAAYIHRATTEMAVTNKRLIIKTGWISRKTVELNLSKVENVAVDQGVFGRLFDYGEIAVVGTGGTREPFKSVQSPLVFRRAVQEQIDAASAPRRSEAA